MPQRLRSRAALLVTMLLLVGRATIATAAEEARNAASQVEEQSGAIGTDAGASSMPAHDRTAVEIARTVGSNDASSMKSPATKDAARLDGGPTANVLSGNTPPDALTTYRNGPSRTIEPGIDDFTGALTHAVPITVPPGRNGLQPDLKLEYHSQRNDQNSLLGYGWALNIPTIGRLNRYGVEKLYANPVFTSDLDGELVQTATGTYASKVEQGSFNAYAYSSANNSWTVTDKLGKVFKFGATAASRMDNATTTAAFRWYLDEIRDTNDNYIKYEYTKSQGQVYPYRITYTGYQTADGPFAVTFALASRPDVTKTFEAGFGVTTASRISEINVAISGVLTRKYALGYATGTNGSRSLLASVTETGYDESSNSTTLPAMQFGYGSAANSPGWTKTTNPGFNTINSGGYDMGHVLIDINGDGLVDDVSGLCVFCSATTSDVSLNSGQSTWTLNPSWQIPLPTAYYQSNSSPPSDSGLRFVDVNGDGLVDLLLSTLSENQGGTNTYMQLAYLNTGSGWAKSSVWTPLVPFLVWDANGDLHDNSVRFADLNGDGLVDMSVSYTGYDLQNNAGNYYNTGAGWTKSGTPPFGFSDGRYDLGTRLVDVNGDGLADFVKNCASTNDFTGSSDVYLNEGGNAWAAAPLWTLPLPTCTHSGSVSMSQDAGMRFMDVNSDGLVDAVQYALTDKDNEVPPLYTQIKAAYINTGSGWTSQPGWAPPGPFIYEYQYPSSDRDYDIGTRTADFDGDGRDDILRDQTPSWYPYSDKGIYRSRSAPELLTSATTTQGGVYRWTYQATPTYRDGSGLLNPSLPSALQVVATSTKDNGFGAVETISFSYQGGKYRYASAYDRTFAGFAKSVATDATGASVTTYYHQGDASATGTGEYLDSFHKIGKPYRQETRDAAGNLFSAAINKWDQQDLGNGRAFVQLARETRKDHDGGGTHRDAAVEYAYDGHGNLMNQASWGEVVAGDDGSFTDIGSDKITTANSYAASGPAGLVTRALVTDQGGATVGDTKQYYDILAFGSATKGNPTKTERWVSGSTYVNSQMAYDSYGLVASETDPRGKVTSYAYDSYKLYPTTVTKPLSQVTQYLYDYSGGKPKQVIDPNLLKFTTVYDGLDRPLEERQPDQSTTSTLVAKTTYAYGDSALGAYVKKTSWLDGTNGVDLWTYLDGFGRLIQTRQESETAGTYAVTDTAYENRALRSKESLPYFSIGCAGTSPTSDATLYTTYGYDALKRPTSVANAIGTTGSAYDKWKTTVTDPRGKVKRFYRDAYGRLVKVEELNGPSSYVTLYEYDPNGSLTKITDANGNVRNFTYDGLGRRLTAQDLHAPADASFGTWTYGYDDAGNRTSTIDPSSRTVSYVFDDLNRVTSEDYTGAAGTEVAYAYDSCPYGKGKLCTATNSGAVVNRQYGATGQVTRETKTISSAAYQTDTAYDRQGNAASVTLPDGSAVQNIYNPGGLLESVQRKESGGAWAELVRNFDYAPASKPTVIAYANSATATNAYDATKLYRLSSKVLTLPGGTRAQDLAYTYDASGNVTRIVDASQTNSAKTVDYGYDDLNRLTGATSTNAVSGGNYAQNFAYDAIGNILFRSDVGAYSYPGASGYANPHAVISASATAYGYNNDGTLASRGTDKFTWNYRALLLSAFVNGATSTYAYDPDGARTRLTEGATSTIYASDWYSVTGGRATKHLYAGGVLVATVEGATSTAVVRFIHPDHLTGSSVVTSSTGTLAELFDYYPYGTTHLDQKAGTFSETRKFAGQLKDELSALNYIGARYYEPAFGRFLSEDPLFLSLGDRRQFSSVMDKIEAPGKGTVQWGYVKQTSEQDGTLRLERLLSDPQKLNSYGYARNNPVKYVDPTGNGPELALPLVLAPEIAVPALAIGAVGTVAYIGYRAIQRGWDPGRQQVPTAYDPTPPDETNWKMPPNTPKWIKYVAAAAGAVYAYVSAKEEIQTKVDKVKAAIPLRKPEGQMKADPYPSQQMLSPQRSPSN